MKPRKRTFALLLGLVLLLGCLCGCTTRQTSIDYVIGVSLANLQEQWRLVLRDELEAEAEKHDNIRLVMTDAAGNSEKQAADVERLMSFDIDLLIISPCDVETLTPVISQVYAEIPVIVLDRAVEEYDYSLFIGPDNDLIGRQAGQTVLSILEEDGIREGTVLELKNDSFASESRSLEFVETVSAAGVNTVSLDLQDATRDCAEDALLAEPQVLDGVDVIFAHNDYMAYGAYLALEKLGIQGIRIVGLDGFSGENGGLQLVEQGIIAATVTCPTGGTEAIQYAIDIMNNVSGIPKQIILRSHQIRADNVADYLQNTRVEKETGTIRVGYAQIDEDSSWRQTSTESIKNAAREFGVDLTLNPLPAENQMEQVRQFIAQGMDVIVISPAVAEGWQAVLEEARQAGIPVLLVDRMVDESEELYTSFIGADFEEEGRRCARWMMQETEKWEKVRILELRGTEGASPALGRKAGFENAIMGDSRYEIVWSECGDFSREAGRQVVERYLRTHEWDIDVIYAHNDDMAVGAIEVLKEHGIDPGKDVKIMSVDGTSEALEALKNGELNCVAECNPLLGPELMKAITDLMDGKELALRIITDESVFTQETPLEELRDRTF